MHLNYGMGASTNNSVASLIWRGSAVSATDLSTYTFSSQDIGTAINGRYVLIAVFGVDSTGGTISVSSVTVGGTAASAVIQLSAANRYSGLWGVRLETGTTADVVVTFSETIEGAGIGTWAAYYLTSTVPVDSQVNTAIGTDSFPALATVPEGIAIWAYGGQTALSTWTWSGGPTERYDATIDGVISHTAADLDATTGASITGLATPSNGATLGTGVCASFR